MVSSIHGSLMTELPSRGSALKDIKNLNYNNRDINIVIDIAESDKDAIAECGKGNNTNQ